MADQYFDKIPLNYKVIYILWQQWQHYKRKQITELHPHAGCEKEKDLMFPVCTLHAEIFRAYVDGTGSSQSPLAFILRIVKKQIY